MLPSVRTLIRNIEGRKTPLVTADQAKELTALSRDIPPVAIAVMLARIEWDMTFRPDERGCHMELTSLITWSDLEALCSAEDIAALEHWEKENCEKLLDLDRLCDRCGHPMHGDVPKEDYCGIRPTHMFGLTSSGFKLFSYCEWCLENYKAGSDSDVPLRINQSPMPKGTVQ